MLNVEQFQRFMAVIRKLSDRVEKEHNQFLRDSQRIEDRSATMTNGINSGQTSRGGLDFETLVGGAGAGTIRADTELNLNWEDDVWGSILSSGSEVCFLLGSWKEAADLLVCVSEYISDSDDFSNSCRSFDPCRPSVHAEPTVVTTLRWPRLPWCCIIKANS